MMVQHQFPVLDAVLQRSACDTPPAESSELKSSLRLSTASILDSMSLVQNDPSPVQLEEWRVIVLGGQGVVGGHYDAIVSELLSRNLSS